MLHTINGKTDVANPRARFLLSSDYLLAVGFRVICTCDYHCLLILTLSSFAALDLEFTLSLHSPV